MAAEANKSAANRLMALSSAVVVMVYAAGYAHTEADARQAAAAMAAFKAQASSTIAPPTGVSPARVPSSASSQATASGTPPVSSGTSSAASSTGTAASADSPSSASPSSAASASASSASASSASASSAASSTGAAASKGAYKDGTFSAIGWGLHGPIQVGVVVRRGKIVSANITGCGTTYSCYYMDPLVSEVVSGQGPPVDYVSGATASSIAYYQAVVGALKKAR